MSGSPHITPREPPENGNSGAPGYSNPLSKPPSESNHPEVVQPITFQMVTGPAADRTEVNLQPLSPTFPERALPLPDGGRGRHCDEPLPPTEDDPSSENGRPFCAVKLEESLRRDLAERALLRADEQAFEVQPFAPAVEYRLAAKVSAMLRPYSTVPPAPDTQNFEAFAFRDSRPIEQLQYARTIEHSVPTEKGASVAAALADLSLLHPLDARRTVKIELLLAAIRIREKFLECATSLFDADTIKSERFQEIKRDQARAFFSTGVLFIRRTGAASESVVLAEMTELLATALAAPRALGLSAPHPTIGEVLDAVRDYDGSVPTLQRFRAELQKEQGPFTLPLSCILASRKIDSASTALEEARHLGVLWGNHSKGSSFQHERNLQTSSALGKELLRAVRQARQHGFEWAETNIALCETLARDIHPIWRAKCALLRGAIHWYQSQFDLRGRDADADLEKMSRIAAESGVVLFANAVEEMREKLTRADVEDFFRGSHILCLMRGIAARLPELTSVLLKMREQGVVQEAGQHTLDLIDSVRALNRKQGNQSAALALGRWHTELATRSAQSKLHPFSVKPT